MDDAPGQVTKFEDMEDHHGTMRWKCRSEILSNRSMYLWGLHALNTEHLLVAKAIALTMTIPSAVVSGVIVDAVLIKASKPTSKSIKSAVDAFQRPDGSEILKLKGQKDTPGCDPLVKHVEARKSAWSRDDDEDGYCRFRPSSLGSWLTNPRFLYERHWKIMDEPAGLGRGTDDTFQEEAAERIAQNGFQGYVAGRGGTGKSSKDHGVLDKVKNKAEAAGCDRIHSCPGK